MCQKKPVDGQFGAKTQAALKANYKTNEVSKETAKTIYADFVSASGITEAEKKLSDTFKNSINAGAHDPGGLI